jgi:hypothetical protein
MVPVTDFDDDGNSAEGDDDAVRVCAPTAQTELTANIRTVATASTLNNEPASGDVLSAIVDGVVDF